NAQYATIASNVDIVSREFGFVANSTDYFVLLKLSSEANSRLVTIQSAAYDDVNDVPVTEGGITWDLNGDYTFASDVNMNAIGIQGLVNSGGSVLADEIRIGDRFSDIITVIPEPSSLALLGVALGILLLFGRKFRL